MKTILSTYQWESRVGEVYSALESFRMPSAKHQAYIVERIDVELNRKHGTRSVYSAYVKGFVRGMCRARDNRVMRDLVEFCYVKDGVLYSTHKASTHRSTEEFYSTGRGCELGGLPSGFYWKGTDKPFFMNGDTTAFRGSTATEV